MIYNYVFCPKHSKIGLPTPDTSHSPFFCPGCALEALVERDDLRTRLDQLETVIAALRTHWQDKEGGEHLCYCETCRALRVLDRNKEEKT